MRLATQRAKKIARAVCAEAQFSVPMAQTVEDEDGAAQTFAVLKVTLPPGVDDFAFRDEFFSALAEDLQPGDAMRLAVRVIRAE